MRAGISTEALLRIGISACFIGHGAFGLLRKEAWLTYFSLFGLGADAARALMPLIGGLDIAVGLLALVWPTRLLFLYAAIWTVFTALLRPLAGEGFAEALERAGNYGLPIALLAALGIGPAGAWMERVRLSTLTDAGKARIGQVCTWATALLLGGHGLLLITGKPLLLDHLAVIGWPAELAPGLGGLELVAAIACVVFPSRGLLLAIAGWKLASESVFIAAGAPIWEFIERGGSYVAPLVGALLLRPEPAMARTATNGAIVRAGLFSAALLLPSSALAQKPGLPRADQKLMAELRTGGYVVACRHAITDHGREDSSPVDFDRPETQRVLSDSGERQAAELHTALGRLGLVFTEIRSSPFQRTRRSAQLMFGAVTVDSALYGSDPAKKARRIELLSEPVALGGNRALVTHQGVLYPLFATMPQGSIAEGDCLAVGPEGATYLPIAHIKPEDWR